ncbi:SAM-dependent methyltransferase [Nocardia suismassiliense]|uniref:SAM-dependent methyltransferase n=1 Tax=Nocardia suismassiliense TaxID=2077092 RepID=UPI00131F25E8|nr:class I SAM-dependent methyltransferase [Nocardia suismassiliense]
MSDGPSATLDDIDRPVFDYMQGYVICSVFAALESAGVLADLAATGLRPDDVGSNSFLTEATFDYLAQRGIVCTDGDTRYRLTELGRFIHADRGYLVWLAGGYGAPLTAFGDLLTDAQTFGKEVDRDVRWVAVGTALVGRNDLWPYVLEVVRAFEFHRIADLGCGNGQSLISLCQVVGATGIGVDISPAACAEAGREVARAGLSDRIEIIEADAGNLKSVPGIDEVDLVITFFFLHEVLEHGYDALVAYLRQIQESLPAKAHILTAEIGPPDSNLDTSEVLAPEYALTQALMKQHLLDEKGWQRAFTEAGFEVRQTIRPDLPGARIILAAKPG